MVMMTNRIIELSVKAPAARHVFEDYF